ncbi:MAG: NTP transferase domain-containing protein [Patescibacteria group bacterium]|nr:NTP transferase domain-containing protein [Patescibacteria group bacterium]
MRNQFVILAAGKGTRMGNPKVPKVLTMLNNKPLILYVLDEIDKISQLAKPVIVVGFHAEEVKGVLGRDYYYAWQDKQLGTAHALLCAKSKVKAENILVVYGDMPFIKAESLRELIKLHFYSGAKLSMLTAQVKHFRGRLAGLKHYGRVIRDVLHNIVGIVEYKDASQQQKNIREINPGIYMFKTAWLWDNLKMIGNQNRQGEYYLTDIVDVAIKQGEKVSSLMVPPEEVIGINSREDLIQAERILNPKP